MKRDWPVFLRKLLRERYYWLKHRWDCPSSLCGILLALFFRRVLYCNGIICRVRKLERIDARYTSSIEGTCGRFSLGIYIAPQGIDPVTAPVDASCCE